MTLQTTGPISLADVNVELSRASSAAISLNESAVRSLAGVASGQISLADLRGKSSVPPAPTVNANPRMFNVTRSTVAAAQTINSDSALTVSGGVAPVTLSIALISGSGISGSIIAGTTARLTSSAPRNSAGARTATFRVTATDNLGRTGTVDISATHEYTSNA